MAQQHIVICDDEELLCVTVADFLRDEGFQVSVVHDGEDVLPIVKKETVDLVLLDLKMQRMNGLEALAQIKKQSPSTKVIMLSAFGSKENIKESQGLGVDGFISKPFGIQTLIQHIKNVLANAAPKSFHQPPL
jgi:DNA-binding response OmpR family regulator